MPKGKNKKVIALMKDELGGKDMTKFVGLRTKNYNHSKDDGTEDKKAKGTKKCVIKGKIKFESYKNRLEAIQPNNKINFLEKKEINVGSLKNNHKEFIKGDRLILKTQQIFESERHNVFTEEINKIPLSSNDDQTMQSIDSIEKYAYEASKDLVSEKEEIECNNIIKRYKND